MSHMPHVTVWIRYAPDFNISIVQLLNCTTENSQCYFMAM